MLRNLWLDEFAAVCLECRERAFLINAHQVAIAGNVGREDGGQPPFYPRLSHENRPHHTISRRSLWSGGVCVYRGSDVCFGSEADICAAISHVRFTPNSDRESRHPQPVMSALPPKADMCGATRDVRFGPIADIAPFIQPSRRRVAEDEKAPQVPTPWRS